MIDEGTYKSPDPNAQTHGVHIVRLYNENDEVDVEIVTDQPYVFSVAFLKEPRLITGFSIEPGRVPYDKSIRVS